LKKEIGKELRIVSGVVPGQKAFTGVGEMNEAAKNRARKILIIFHAGALIVPGSLMKRVKGSHRKLGGWTKRRKSGKEMDG